VTHEFARKLRREQTEVGAQSCGMRCATGAFTGSNFAGSSPLDPTSPISICFEAKLIIELDGSQHAFRKMRRWNGYERHFSRRRDFACCVSGISNC